MTRKIYDHKGTTPANEALEIAVLDEPSFGGASHEYVVRVPSGEGYPIYFQKGPIKEHGVNGITEQALLAIVMDRLRGFQSGQFSCRENALALTKIEEAMHWLHARTMERQRRGVEGVNMK